MRSKSKQLLPSLEIIAGKDDGVNYPMLNKRVLFVGNCFLSGAVKMFRDAGCEPAKNVDDAELVVFLGGADINPDLYNEPRHRTTHFDAARDEAEIAIYHRAEILKVPMFGICRGMQFIHAMSGGKLWQDVRHHAGPSHSITDIETGEKLMSTSLHHQMCRYDGRQVPVAHSSETLSKLYCAGSGELTSNSEIELEAAYYPKINAFGTQGHPELHQYEEYTTWCLRKIQRLYDPTPFKMDTKTPRSSTMWNSTDHTTERKTTLRQDIAAILG